MESTIRRNQLTLIAELEKKIATYLATILPDPRYFERLEDEIRAHLQGVDETFKDYLVVLRSKMQQVV